MGWGRYSTSDIERLMLIAGVAVVLGVSMPVYVQLRDLCLAGGTTLAWYHHLGLASISLIAGGLAVFTILGLLFCIGRWIEWMSRRP